MQSSQPPGLEQHGRCAQLIAEGGGDWRPVPKFKEFTNAFVWHPDQGRLLLGHKKRGFGQGLWNGFGGKVEAGESPLEAAERELHEEAGIVAKLEPCGVLLFVLEGVEFAYHVHIYRSHEYEGDPIETDEMRPDWFLIPSEYHTNDVLVNSSLPPIPYENMWDDDRLWIPFLLSKTYFVGRIDFTNSVEQAQHASSRKFTMQKWWIGTPESDLL